MKITIADLVTFAAAHHGLVWHAALPGGARRLPGTAPLLVLHWQCERDAAPDLLDALTDRFGVTWPEGRVAIFATRSHPDQGTVLGLCDAGLDRPVTVHVTVFDPPLTPAAARRLEL